MRKRAVLTCAAAGGIAVLCGPASADIFIWQFPMDGSQEVPPVDTTGTGEATVTLDSDTGEVTVIGTYMDMVSVVIDAHIHGLAPPGQNAGIIVPLNVTGGTEGVVSGSGTLTPDQITGMIEGLTYVNIHSQLYPAGEIRGQIVPAPAGLALLGIGALASRRRRA